MKNNKPNSKKSVFSISSIINYFYKFHREAQHFDKNYEKILKPFEKMFKDKNLLLLRFENLPKLYTVLLPALENEYYSKVINFTDIDALNAHFEEGMTFCQLLIVINMNYPRKNVTYSTILPLIGKKIKYSKCIFFNFE